MRNAALDLVDIIYGNEDEIDNLWVSLVPYVADGEHRHQPDRLAGGRRPGADQPGELPADLTGGGWKGCVMAQRLCPTTPTTRRPRAAVHLVLLRPTTARADNNWPTIKTSTTRARQRSTRHRERTEPRLRLADHAADRLEGDGQGRRSTRWALASRRHRRQPRAGLGLAHALAAVARPLGRQRRPAARLRRRLHGEGRGAADRRQQRVPRPHDDSDDPGCQPRTSPPTAASRRCPVPSA